MISFPDFPRAIVFVGVVLMLAARAMAEGQEYPWTVLIPKNDSRDAEVRAQDDFDSRSLVASMNLSEQLFAHRLVWKKIAIADLLSTPTPFCELRFDAVHPLVLTDREKEILHEYFSRGGFILLQEDAYPYDESEFWPVKSWPVIDWLTKELPAADKDFSVTRVNDSHLLFRYHYVTKTAEYTRHELEGNSNTPNRTLVSYRGSPCAFVFGRYHVVENGKWVAEPRPFRRVFSMDPRGYQLTVNIYAYALLH